MRPKPPKFPKTIFWLLMAVLNVCGLWAIGKFEPEYWVSLVVMGGLNLLGIGLFYKFLRKDRPVRMQKLPELEVKIPDVSLKKAELGGRNYAYGLSGEVWLCFRQGPLGGNGYRGGPVGLVVRAKVPASAHIRMNLSVLPEEDGNAPGPMGWKCPQPGFFLGKIRPDVNEDQGVAFFELLSATSREKLQALASPGGRASLTPDWESTIIGRDQALKLVEGDELALQSLDLQFVIPNDFPEAERQKWIQLAMDAALLISEDFKKAAKP